MDGKNKWCSSCLLAVPRSQSQTDPPKIEIHRKRFVNTRKLWEIGNPESSDSSSIIWGHIFCWVVLSLKPPTLPEPLEKHCPLIWKSCKLFTPQMLTQETRLTDNIIYASQLPTLGCDPCQILQGKQKQTAAALRILQGLLGRCIRWDQQSLRWHILHHSELSEPHWLQFTAPEELLSSITALPVAQTGYRHMWSHLPPPEK